MVRSIMPLYWPPVGVSTGRSASGADSAGRAAGAAGPAAGSAPPADLSPPPPPPPADDLTCPGRLLQWGVSRRHPRGRSPDPRPRGARKESRAMSDSTLPLPAADHPDAHAPTQPETAPDPGGPTQAQTVPLADAAGGYDEELTAVQRLDH